MLHLDILYYHLFDNILSKHVGSFYIYFIFNVFIG